MKIRAIESFSGALCMAKGEVVECEDKELLDDLLQAGYIEPVKKPTKRGTNHSDS